MQKFIDRLKSQNSFTPPPLDAETLIYAQKTLSQLGFCALPAGFVSFLHLLNGFSSEGCHIFGIIPDPMNFMDVVNVNVIRPLSPKNEKIILADNELDFLIYNQTAACYQIIDKQDMEVLEEYSELEPALGNIIKI